jgi:RES domain-containing protein
MTYAGAMLEVLAHTNTGKVPPSHRCVTADVPDHLAVTRYELAQLPAGWDAQDSESARSLGDDWLQECATALLVVPSVVARMEFNVLVNPAHPDASRIKASPPEAVLWDSRLFSR